MHVTSAGIHLRGSETLIPALACGACKLLDVESLLAGHRIGDDAVRNTIAAIACRQHCIMHELDVSGRQIPIAHAREAASPPRVLQSNPVDDRRAREDPVE